MVAKHFSKYLLKKRKNRNSRNGCYSHFNCTTGFSIPIRKKQNVPSRKRSPTLPFCPIKIEGKKRNEIQKFQKVDCQYKKPITRINIPPPFLFTGEKTSDRAHVHNKLFCLGCYWYVSCLYQTGSCMRTHVFQRGSRAPTRVLTLFHSFSRQAASLA